MSNFNMTEFGTELAVLQRGGYQQTALIVIDLSATFTDLEIPVPGGATLLALLPRVLDGNGSEQTSNTAERVYLKLNGKAGPGLPYSLIASAGDSQVFAGAIAKISATNLTATPGAKLYFLLGVGISIGSATGGPSGGGYAPPTVKTSGIQ